MAVASGERLVAVEWIVVVLVQTGDALASPGRGPLGGIKLPNPSRYIASMVAYLMLAALALFGPRAAKMAGAIGGVAALAILMAPAEKGGKPLILSFFNYVNALMVGGVISQPGQSQLPPAKGSSYSGPGYPVAANQNYGNVPGLGNKLPVTPGVGAQPGQAQGISPGLPLKPT
jgi:hypothetical protein